MTNSRGGQGQSQDTEWKERGIRSTIAVTYSVVTRKLPWAKYFHFDLNAGCGWNHEYNVVGSPLAFWDVADGSGHERTIAYFVERHGGRAAELEARPEMAGRPNCFVRQEDNGVFCRRIPDIIRSHRDRPEMAMGTILIDPNGPTEVPYDAIAAVLAECPRLDVIYNFPGTGTKRMPDGHRQKVTITDIPRLFRKQHWLIRQQIGMHQFSLLIGRNFKFGDHKNLGFFHWDSFHGQAVVHKLKTSQRAQKKKQLEMF